MCYPCVLLSLFLLPRQVPLHVVRLLLSKFRCAYVSWAIVPLPLRTLCSLVSNACYLSHSFNFLPSVAVSPKSCCFMDFRPKPPEQSCLQRNPSPMASLLNKYCLGLGISLRRSVPCLPSSTVAATDTAMAVQVLAIFPVSCLQSDEMYHCRVSRGSLCAQQTATYQACGFLLHALLSRSSPLAPA